MPRWKKALYAFVVVIFFMVAASAEAMSDAPKQFDTPVVTGEHWVVASQQERQAFLLGMATIIELEQEVQGGAQEGCKTLVHSWITGMGSHSITDVRMELDEYFRINADKRSRPVVEVLWYEFVSPKLKVK